MPNLVHIKVFYKEATLQAYIKALKSKGKSIGFVPTMGALHNGHMSLIKATKKIADITVCSIFVNPTQFNDQTDLDKYPITIEADTQLLEDNGVDVLFLPSVSEVYPPGLDTDIEIDLGGMDNVMEGAFRDGHFAGVMQVVNRLLDMVLPDYLVMGHKDFQQFSIIQRMLTVLKIDTKLHIVPIKRQENGLAMSSRNKRLSSSELLIATTIYKTLSYAKRKIKKGDTLDNVRSYALNRLTRAGFKPEYVSIADIKNLQEKSVLNKGQKAVICVAAWLGEVRLIDNMVVEG